jgi:Gpi18-like mannosyltransferase
VQTLVVYAVSRLWLVVVFTQSAARQPPNRWTTTVSPSYFEFVSGQFDGDWYRKIAECEPGCGFGGLGYPTDLPTDADGSVQQNAWAFFPAFPLLVRTVMNLTGGTWTVTAPLVATVVGALAMLVVHRLIVDAAPAAVTARPGLPLATVAVVCAFPTAPVLQTAYTESLALLLIAGSLWAIVRRWYLLAAVTVVALGFTRAVALAMAVVVVVHAAARWWTARQARDPAASGRSPADDHNGLGRPRNAGSRSREPRRLF